MVTPAESLGVLRVALHHPMRIWVDSMESLLRSRWDIDLVAAHTSPDWVFHAVATGRADILLMHMSPADRQLSARLDDLRNANPALHVVGLSDSDDPRLVTRAVRAGVRGWLEPTVSLDHLDATLHGVARGETWIPPRLLTAVLEALLTTEDAREELGGALRTLSAREIDILSCLVEGMSRQDIADRYVLSTHTVRTHINNVLRKLDVHSTLAAVSIARQVGLPDQREKP